MKLNLKQVQSPAIFAAPPAGKGVKLRAFLTTAGDTVLSNADIEASSPVDGTEMTVKSPATETFDAATLAKQFVTVASCPHCATQLMASASMADAIDVAEADLHCVTCSTPVVRDIDVEKLTSALAAEYTDDSAEDEGSDADAEDEGSDADAADADDEESDDEVDDAASESDEEAASEGAQAPAPVAAAPEAAPAAEAPAADAVTADPAPVAAAPEAPAAVVADPAPAVADAPALAADEADPDSESDADADASSDSDDAASESDEEAADRLVDWATARVEVVASADGSKHVFAENLPVGRCVEAKASEAIRARWSDDVFKQAFLTTAKSGAALAQFGFEPYAYKIDGSRAIRAAVHRAEALATARAEREIAHSHGVVDQSVKTAALASIKGVYPDLKCPVRDGLVSALNRLGVADAGRVVDAQFAAHASAWFDGVFEKAAELQKKSDEARNEVVQFVATASYQSRTSDADALSARLAAGPKVIPSVEAPAPAAETASGAPRTKSAVVRSGFPRIQARRFGAGIVPR